MWRHGQDATLSIEDHPADDGRQHGRTSNPRASRFLARGARFHLRLKKLGPAGSNPAPLRRHLSPDSEVQTCARTGRRVGRARRRRQLVENTSPFSSPCQDGGQSSGRTDRQGTHAYACTIAVYKQHPQIPPAFSISLGFLASCGAGKIAAAQSDALRCDAFQCGGERGRKGRRVAAHNFITLTAPVRRRKQDRRASEASDWADSTFDLQDNIGPYNSCPTSH